MKVEDARTLVLNKDYSPLELIPVTRAFTMCYKGRSETLHEYDDVELRTPTVSFQAPSVIRITEYIKVPYRNVSLTRQNIYKRDNSKCVYCGSSHNLTLDHVIPKSKGGKDTWKNMVTACKMCNHKKGDKMTHPETGETIDPDELNAFRPSYFYLMNRRCKYEKDWKPYLFT